MHGDFHKELASLTADDWKAALINGLTEQQRKAIELVSAACSIGKSPKGATAIEVASLECGDNGNPTSSAVETMRQRLKSLVVKGILRSSKDGRSDRFQISDD